MLICYWSSDVCSSDLVVVIAVRRGKLDIARHRYLRLDLDALRRDLAGLEDVDRIERIVGRPVALDDVVIIGGDQHAVARLPFDATLDLAAARRHQRHAVAIEARDRLERLRIADIRRQPCPPVTDHTDLEGPGLVAPLGKPFGLRALPLR